MSLLISYLQLCWFQNNPTELHPPQSFLWKCIGFYLASGIVVEANISDPADATLEVAMRAVVALTLLSGLVFFTKNSPLFKQLLAGVFMCENFIMTLGIGVEIYDAFVQGTEYEEYPTYLGVFLILWYMANISYVFKQVFDFRTYSSIGLAAVYFALTYGGPFLVMEVI